MGATTNQIESFIENKREDLGSNLQELEQKVKSITDWRQQFRNNPMTMVAVAFGGGVALASMLGSGRGNRGHRTTQRSVEHHAGAERQSHMALETWDNIKGALIGVAATRFKGFIEEIVPGFHEEFRKTEAVKNPPA
jgi:hypothetical protein